MDMNDDRLSDRLDYLADRHADFFEWLELLFDVPETPPDWDLQSAPSAEELAGRDEEAENFLASLDWIWHEDENWRME